METKPQLEIYADDVKCSHGATVGQLNEDELLQMLCFPVSGYPGRPRGRNRGGIARVIVHKSFAGNKSPDHFGLGDCPLNRLSKNSHKNVGVRDGPGISFFRSYFCIMLLPDILFEKNDLQKKKLDEKEQE